MFRYLAVTLIALPLTACAAKQQPLVTAEINIQNMTTETQNGSEGNFAAMALDNNVKPCPRFTDSLSAAEQKLNGTPRNYVHML